MEDETTSLMVKGQPALTGAAGGAVFFRVWATTDVGRQRVGNEDSYYIDPSAGLFLVLDGMGGHRAGEVASKMAMESIVAFFREHVHQDPATQSVFEAYDAHFTYEANLLRQAVLNANRDVLQHSRTKEEYQGMGSTVAALAVKDFTASMINVGDSRVYLIKSGVIEQLSKDHTLAEDQVERGLITREEARDSQLRHILSSVIGVDGRIRIHMDELVINPGDMFLLCTDGLVAVMDDDEILEYLLEAEPGAECLDRLVNEVNQRGGPDNTTLALAVFFEGENGSSEDS
jgi:PPM family protein phosphatase